MRGPTGRLVLAWLAVLLLALTSPSLVHAAQGTAPELVPTTTCACQATVMGGPAPPQFKGPPQPPSTAGYDEQLGMTFTQSFTSLEYNVTAVAQTDAATDSGPAYLLNGLTSAGYWYQVGLSWNWDPGQTPGTGFDMNYEVFDPAQNSIFPANGGGGLVALSGPVSEGDNVTLNLYFSSSNQVVMQAVDANTGASASETYGAMGGTYFTGSPSAVANSNGYFTGLMNEWYHGEPFYANGEQVVFSDSKFAQDSAWMWMDEFNANTLKLLFSGATPAPVVYSSPNSLQEFSYNGTLEYSDAHEFITGNATGASSNTVVLTFSYSVEGGGTRYVPPALTYVSGGTKTTVALTTSATPYTVDSGSTWSVSPILNGSASAERWQTNQTTTGSAKSAETIDFQYYHQLKVTFGYAVSGGGSGFSSPTVTYEWFGSGQPASLASTSQSSSAVWADAGSRYSLTDPLPGSTSGERWNSNSPSGTVSAAGPITVTYYNQFLLTVDATFKGSEIFPSVSIRTTSGGLSFTGTVVQGANSFWVDADAQYSLPQTVSLSAGEQWSTSATTTGTVSGELTVPLTYQYQYHVSFTVNVVGGGTVSATSGWYLPGTSIQADAVPSTGWQVEGWTGSGAGSTSSATGELSILLSGPANETAVFFPGLTVTSSGPISVSYQDESVSGVVSAGGSSVIYVPPSSNITLSASSPPFLYSFTGWSGAASSHASSITLQVNGPESERADSSYNYQDITMILAAAILVAMGVLLTIRKPRRQVLTSEKETVGSPAA
jgi:hypothetical protein